MGNTTSNLCYQPFAFPLPLNISSCAPGFYCPNISLSDPFTYPNVCPPTVDCSLNRLASKYCDPQGPYEPQTCPPGFYCPDPTTIVPCPEGSYCLRASAAPQPCPPMSYCPPQTEMRRYYGGIVIAIVVDLLMLAAYVWYRYRGEPGRWKARREARRAAGGFALAASGGSSSSVDGGSAAMEMSLLGTGTGQGQGVGALAGEYGQRAKDAVLQALSTAASKLPLELPLGLGGGGGGAGAEGSYLQLDKDAPSIPLAPMGGEGPSSSSSSTPSAPASGFVSGSALDALPAKRCLEEAFKRCNAGLSMELAFDNLGFTLPPPDGRTILSGVSGRIVPGRVTAIMGPSGAGKTTFLNVLMGKYNRTSGVLSINGRADEMHRYKRIIGYVPQDDVMIRELTVRENILFSARVRLPTRGWTDAAINAHVDAVIQVLGLAGCADTLACRVSGGQRKRTNIGMELAACPATIFLDEPTSGLDSTAALEVCGTLRSVADLGLTVVAVIHQPRIEIFQSFHDLLLLAPGGLTVFAGPQACVVPYFGHLGFEFQPGSNPADDLLDFVAGKGKGSEGFLEAFNISQSVTNHNSSFVVSSPRTPAQGSGGFSGSAWAAKGSSGSSSAEADGGYSPLPGLANGLPTLGSVLGYGFGLGFATPAKSGGSTPPTVLAPVASPPSVAAMLAQHWAGRGQGELRALKAQAAKLKGLGGGSNASLSGMGLPLDGPSSTGRGLGHGLDTSVLSEAGTVGEGEEDAAFRSKPTLGLSHVHNSSSSGEEDGSEALLSSSSSTGAAFDPTSLSADRGAPFLRQVLLCHNRAVVQQYRTASSYVLEMCVGMLAGAIMGSAAMQLPELYVGVLKPPYTLLSPSPLETLLPSIGMYVALAVGLAGSPAGVKTFGEEKEVFYREAASGHNKLAYYCAKSISQIYRFTLGAMHFTAVFHVLASPATDFTTMFSLVWCQYFAVYGLAALTSMVVARENSALLGVIVALIAGCLCGFGPSLVQGRKWGIGFLQDLSHARWANEAFFHAETLYYRDNYMVEEVSAPLFGYTLDRPGYDVGMMLVIGLGHRLLAYGLLVGLNRDKQR